MNMVQYFKNMTMFNRIRFVVCCFLIFIGIIYFITSSSQIASLRNTYESNKETIVSLKKQLAELNTEPESKEEVKKTLISCKDKGAKVAELQTKYQKYNASNNPDEFQSIVTDLLSYFDDSASNARVPWYNPDVKNKNWTWTFETSYSFTATSVPVLWTCKSDDGILLAYATGVYDSAKGLFKDMKWATTSFGLTQAPPTTQPPTEDITEIETESKNESVTDKEGE